MGKKVQVTFDVCVKEATTKEETVTQVKGRGQVRAWVGCLRGKA